MNENILRDVGPGDPLLTDLQKVLYNDVVCHTWLVYGFFVISEFRLKLKNILHFFQISNEVRRKLLQMTLSTSCLQAEELIKREMLIMLHHDSAKNPTEAQLGIAPGSKKTQPSQQSVANQAAHLAFLKQHPLEKIPEEEIEMVSEIFLGILIVIPSQRLKCYLIMLVIFSISYLVLRVRSQQNVVGKKHWFDCNVTITGSEIFCL